MAAELNPTSANTEDTSTWLPLDGLAPGFDAHRAPRSTDLAGFGWTAVFPDGERIRYDFALDTVRSAGERAGCEVFEVDAGLYYAQFQHTADPTRATSLVLDLTGGHALLVRSRIGAATQRPTAVSQEFRVGALVGIPPAGEPPAPTRDLLGRRVLWRYSPGHVYEHVYLTEQWYTFHCLAGPERGLADTDACAYYRLRPGIYLFAWREKVIPCAAVTVADHRLFRSHGALFGLDERGTGTTHFTFGAHGQLLSHTVHPPLA